MDSRAFDEIIQRQFDELFEFVQREQVLPEPELNGRIIFVPVDGFRQSGQRDHFLLVIDANAFPLYPYDVGFINPKNTRHSTSTSEFKDPKWFPYDNEKSFKTAFSRSPNVFICIQPGFTREYFVHHINEQWNPHAWTLLRVVAQVRQALNAESYIQPNWERT